MTTRTVPKPVEDVLKKLMLELLYPAVLGSVLYFALDVTRLLFHGKAFWNSVDAPLVVLKCLLLYVTVIFYGCDYVYIMLTRTFRVKFFWYDCAFLIGLYVTVVSLRVKDTELSQLPMAWLISGFYALFFVMYWAWDRSEQNDPASDDEKRFYLQIVKWEKQSLVILLLTAIVTWGARDRSWASVLLLFVLAFVTEGFFHFVREKRHFANVAPSTDSVSSTAAND